MENNYMDDAYQEVNETTDPSLKEKYWETGFGLNQIDFLKPSNYLSKVLLPEHLKGKLSYEEVEESLVQHYQTQTKSDSIAGERECDLVSTRIANLLDNGGFTFSPGALKGIHRFLFKDILPDNWIGEFRQKNIYKKEPILDGETVTYANYFMIQDTLQYDFEIEKRKNYIGMKPSNLVKSIANFTSSIWQVHPFREGNTRTVAVFLVQYLNNLGFDLNNQPFEKNAGYFRNALVRANYSNYSDNAHSISATDQFLIKFFENLLTDACYELNEQELLIIPAIQKDRVDEFEPEL